MDKYCMNCMFPKGENEVCPSCGLKEEERLIPHQLKQGTILSGRYLVGKAIGQGGFGITYIGRDLRLDMKIAIKEYYPNGYANRNTAVSPDITVSNKIQEEIIEDGKQKFLNEARVLAQFNDEPGIVDVRDFFEENNTAYIIMEYLEGQDLRSYLKKSLFSSKEILDLMKPVMEAMEKIHAKGIVHRDISPDNIMLVNNRELKLMDFGAARLVDYSDQKSISVVLKAGYAPEEQYRPKGVQGPWTDIYALCATMYKCMTGVTPDDALQRGYKDEMKWPSEFGIEITVYQENVLKKGMSVKQAERYQTIGEFREELYRRERTGDVSSIDIVDNEPEDDKTQYFDHRLSNGNTEDCHEQKEGEKQEEKQDNSVQDEAKDMQEEREGGQERTEEDKIESEKKESEKKRVINSKILIPTISVLALVILCIGIWAIGGRKSKDSPTVQNVDKIADNPADNPVDVPADNSVYNPDTMYHITLTADETLTVKEYNAAIESLKARLDVFAGAGAYEMDISDDAIQLYIDKNKFIDGDIKNELRWYLSREMNLSLCELSNEGNIVEGEVISLTRANIEKVEVKEGVIEGLDAKEYGIDTDSYKYIEIVLDEDFSKSISKKMKVWGDNVILVQDMEYQTNCNYVIIRMKEDGRTLDALINDYGGNYVDVVAHNWENAPLAGGFTFYIDIENLVEWESAQEENHGINQCDAEEFTGKTVTILYYTYYSEISEGEWVDIKSIFKRRLDLLEQPYAMGRYVDQGMEKIAVKTGLEHMGRPIMSLIGKQEIDIKLQGSFMACSFTSSFASDNSQMSTEKGKDGTYNFVVESEEGKSSYYGIEEISKLLAKKHGGKLSIAIDHIPYVGAFVDKEIADGKVIFSELEFSDDRKITDDNLWAVQLLSDVMSDDKMPHGFNVESVAFNADENGDVPDESQFGCSMSQEMGDIRDKIKKIDESIKVNFSASNTIQISVGLPVDETLPEKSLEIVEKIYQESGFEESNYPEMIILLADEDKLENEWARVMFRKYFLMPSVLLEEKELEDGYVYVSGIFKSGRMERYKNHFEELISENEFIKKYSNNSATTWDFGYLQIETEAEDVNLYVGNEATVQCHVSEAVGNETQTISFKVNGYEEKKHKFKTYHSFFEIEEEEDGTCKLKMLSEGTGTLILDIYTEDYGILRETISVSAYTMIENMTVTINKDCNIYRCAATEIETDDSGIGAQASAGDIVTAVGKCEGFFFIKMENGGSGFVLADDIDMK